MVESKQPKPLDKSETVQGQMSIPTSARMKLPKKKEADEKKDDLQGSMLEALDEMLSEIDIEDEPKGGPKKRRGRNQHKSKTYAARKKSRKAQKTARRKNRK